MSALSKNDKLLGKQKPRRLKLSTLKCSYVYAIEDFNGKVRYVGSGPYKRPIRSQSQQAYRGISTRYWYVFGPVDRATARLLERDVIEFYKEAGQCDWNIQKPGLKKKRLACDYKKSELVTLIPEDHPSQDTDQLWLFRPVFHLREHTLGKVIDYDPKSFFLPGPENRVL